VSEVPGPVEPGPFRYHARATVADMLKEAQAALLTGYTLLLMSVYRSLDEQAQLYEKVKTDLREQNPHWPKNILIRETNRWVHPPHAKTPPGHSTGGAVDLVIGGPDGEPLDFTAPFAFDYEGEPEKFSPTFSPHVDEIVRRNRALLIDVMVEAGFTNYAGEFWHWSYGDSCWAWRLGRKTARYGAAPPPA